MDHGYSARQLPGDPSMKNYKEIQVKVMVE